MPRMTIDYSTLQEPEKSEKALKDFRQYVGEEPYNALVLMTEVKSKDWVRMAVAMLMGVEGFPVDAFIAKHYPKNEVK